jgi:hypothetical protein
MRSFIELISNLLFLACSILVIVLCTSNVVLSTFLIIGAYMTLQIILIQWYVRVFHYASGDWIFYGSETKRTILGMEVFKNEKQDLMFDSIICDDSGTSEEVSVGSKIIGKLLSYGLSWIFLIVAMKGLVNEDIKFLPYVIVFIVIAIIKMIITYMIKINIPSWFKGTKLVGLCVILFFSFVIYGMIELKQKVELVKEEVQQVYTEYLIDSEGAINGVKKVVEVYLPRLEKDLEVVVSQEKNLLKEISSFLEAYPKEFIRITSTANLKKVPNGEFIRIKALPGNIHIESTGNLNFDFSGTGISDYFWTGGIFSRSQNLSIAITGTGSGKQNALTAIDGKYWSVFTDIGGEVFIAKEALPAHLVMSQTLAIPFKNYQGVNKIFSSRQITVRDAIKAVEKVIKINAFEHKWDIHIKDKKYPYFMGEEMSKFVKAKGELTTQLEEATSNVSELLGIRNHTRNIKEALNESFLFNEEVALQFKLQVDADRGKTGLYDLFGVKTEHKDVPIVNIVGFVRNNYSNKYLYKINSAK